MKIDPVLIISSTALRKLFPLCTHPSHLFVFDVPFSSAGERVLPAGKHVLSLIKITGCMPVKHNAREDASVLLQHSSREIRQVFYFRVRRPFASLHFRFTIRLQTFISDSPPVYELFHNSPRLLRIFRRPVIQRIVLRNKQTDPLEAVRIRTGTGIRKPDIIFKGILPALLRPDHKMRNLCIPAELCADLLRKSPAVRYSPAVNGAVNRNHPFQRGRRQKMPSPCHLENHLHLLTVKGAERGGYVLIIRLEIKFKCDPGRNCQDQQYGDQNFFLFSSLSFPHFKLPRI